MTFNEKCGIIIRKAIFTWRVIKMNEVKLQYVTAARDFREKRTIRGYIKVWFLGRKLRRVKQEGGIVHG